MLTGMLKNFLCWKTILCHIIALHARWMISSIWSKNSVLISYSVFLSFSWILNCPWYHHRHYCKPQTRHKWFLTACGRLENRKFMIQLAKSCKPCTTISWVNFMTEWQTIQKILKNALRFIIPILTSQLSNKTKWFKVTILRLWMHTGKQLKSYPTVQVHIYNRLLFSVRSEICIDYHEFLKFAKITPHKN